MKRLKYDELEEIRKLAQGHLEDQCALYGFTPPAPLERSHVVGVLWALTTLDTMRRPAPASAPEDPPDGVEDVLPTGVTNLPPESKSLKSFTKSGSRPRGRSAIRIEQALEMVAHALEKYPGAWVNRRLLLEQAYGREVNSYERNKIAEALRQRYGDRLLERRGRCQRVDWQLAESATELPAPVPAEPVNPKQPSSASAQALEGEVLERAQAQSIKTTEIFPMAVERLPEGGFIRPVEPSPEIQEMLRRMEVGRASPLERAKVAVASDWKLDWRPSK